MALPSQANTLPEQVAVEQVGEDEYLSVKPPGRMGNTSKQARIPSQGRGPDISFLGLQSRLHMEVLRQGWQSTSLVKQSKRDFTSIPASGISLVRL